MVYKLMTTEFRPMDTIAYNSPFILMTELSSTSPWDLLIVDSKFEPVSAVQSKWSPSASYKKKSFKGYAFVGPLDFMYEV